METGQINEIALSMETVLKIVEDALNARWLQTAHRVVELDLDTNRELVRFDLELRKDEPGEVVHLAQAAPVAVGEASRSNGTDATQPSASENGKRRLTTDAQRQAIYEAIKADPKRTASSIAAEVGVSVMTVAGYVTQYRKALAEMRSGNGGGNNRLEAEPAAVPTQEPF